MAAATLAWHFPDDVREGDAFCLVRIGMIARRLTLFPKVRRVVKWIDQAAQIAASADSGLLKSERMIFSWNHFGCMQYWRSVDAMLEWTHAQPHTDWWKWALERQRTHQDLSFYHETYVVGPGRFEAIYMNLGEARPGASAFGDLRPPQGASGTARGRLGRLPQVGVTGEPARVDQAFGPSRSGG